MGDPGSVTCYLLTPTRFGFGTGMAMHVPGAARPLSAANMAEPDIVAPPGFGLLAISISAEQRNSLGGDPGFAAHTR